MSDGNATALVRYERSISALTEAYGDASRYNLLVPRMGMSDVPHGMRLVASRIEIDPNPAAGDVYKIPGGDKLGIGKAKLNAIGNAIGLTWVVSERVDDRQHPHYVEWHVMGQFMLPDGTVVTRHAHKAIDLRSDAGGGEVGADLIGMSERQIPGARKHILTMAETKAMNRAIRSAASLNTSYTREQLRKPFVAVKLAADPQSELGGKAALAALYGGTAALFGPPPTVDAEIVPPLDGEMDPPSSKAIEAEVGGGTEAPPTSSPDDVGIDPRTGEMLPGAPEVSERIEALWRDCKAQRMPAPVFVELAREASGKEDRSQMTLEDIEAFEAAIGEWFSTAEDGSPL